MYFGSNIRFMRKKTGKSRKDLAELIGISEKNYGHYETGYTNPPLHKAHTISKYFKVSLATLIDKDLTRESKLNHQNN